LAEGNTGKGMLVGFTLIHVKVSRTAAGNESADSCCTLHFSEGGFWAYTVESENERVRGWAQDDVDIIDADLPRWIGTRRHALRCARFTVIHVRSVGNESAESCCPSSFSWGEWGYLLSMRHQGLAPDDADMVD